MSEHFKVTTFKERFSELFDESEKTITDLSKDLHVSNQTISAWKLGTRSPKEPTVIAIANHFNVSVEWLLGFNVPKDYKLNTSNQYYGAEPPDDQPQTEDVRLLVRDLNRLSPEQVEQAKEMFRLMFKITNPELFKEETDHDPRL